MSDAIPVLTDACILIVDDQELNVHLLERLLGRAGYVNLRSTSDARLALAAFLDFAPDLVLLDLHMPHVDGFTVLEQIRSHVPQGSYLPIVVLTGDASQEAKQRALSAGAKDFIGKPFDTTEVLLRINNQLETRFLHLALQRQNEHLEETVRRRTRELENAQVEILQRLALAAEFRDDATHEHTSRVGAMASRLAHRLGVAEDTVELLGRAAPLHDLGKIGVPDTILLKRERLSDEEFGVVKTHTHVGAQILSGSTHPLLQLAEQIARTHHEHWDGSGYTPGLKGDAIPLVSRIVAVVDVFDALTHARPYKPAWPVDEAVAELLRQRGRQFDPLIVDEFLQMLKEDGVY